jgi:hypothetical protein
MALCEGGKMRSLGAQGVEGTYGYMFWCPGCKDTHAVNVAAHPNGNRPVWGFNGDTVNPTFTPSLLVRSGHFAPGHPGPECWCTYNQKHPDDPAPYVCQQCHTFITNGMIQFLGDCSHHLVGQTVPMPPFPEEY